MNPRNTLIVTGIAILLFLYVWIFESDSDVGPEEPAPVARLLPDLNPDQIASINVIVSSNQVFQVKRSDGSWMVHVPFQYPARQNGIQALLDSLAEVTRRYHIPAEQVQRQPAGLAGFGLQPPKATLFLNYKDGSKTELRFGTKTAVGDQMYVQLMGQEGLFATSANLVQRLPNSVHDWRDPSLLSLKGVDFNRISVRAGNRSFELQRNPTNNLWRLTHPLPTRANSSKVTQLLQQLENARVNEFVSDSPRSMLEPYGLEPPRVELAIGNGTNDQVVVQFGKSPTNQPSQVFARRLAHSNVVLVSQQVVEPLHSTYTAFRDPYLLSAPSTNIDRVHVGTGTPFTLTKTNGNWRVTDPVQVDADPALVEEFLTRLNEIRIIDYPKDAATDFDYENYGLDQPASEYSLWNTVTNNSTITNRLMARISFGTNETGEVFARRSDENSIYAIAPGRLPKAYFEIRTRRIWNFQHTNVVALDISRHEKAVRLIRSSDGTWNSPGVADSQINQGALQEAVFQISRLRAEDWVARADEMRDVLGFNDLNLRLALNVRKDERLAPYKIQFGKFAASGNPYAITTIDGEEIIFEFPLSTYVIYQQAVQDITFEYEEQSKNPNP